ncbi:signal-regulatory protein beta-2-like [Acanthopagrus latus]|uniref:signal-regulatory protein beta-2-like n=1 Tax=Acanthopagrus latus TaxID=8177 RepID=UPI00187C9494|nr:signal-regulatory protein beta-2-like [Acanthopagrus latus]
MLIIVHVLLVLELGGFTADPIFETQTVGVGQNVTLTCERQKTWHHAYLHWIRLVSGNFPEVLGGTFALDVTDVVQTHRITTKQEPGKFVLHILETQLGDTAIYYCIKVAKFKMTFLKGTFLRIKGPEPDVTAITQDSLSDPVRPGDSVTLQCSVLSDSQNKPCPGDHSVFWFRAGSDESDLSFIYAHGNGGAECETSLEARSPQKCVYSFSKNVSSSDAGTYYCAVATCGEILFGNGTKLDIEVIGTCDSMIVLLLCAAVAVSLIVIGVLVFAIKKKSCDCCNAVVTPQMNAAAVRGDQQSQQRNEDASVYYRPTFIQKKPRKSGRRRAREEETIYSDVRNFVID